MIRGENFVQAYGETSVFVSHFLGPVRHIIPAAAGALRLNRFRFERANIPGAVLWSVAHLAIGYYFGTLWESLLPLPLRLAATAAFAMLLSGVVTLIYRRFES
jgi:membrane protein DedA with SNARE-associated domain